MKKGIFWTITLVAMLLLSFGSGYALAAGPIGEKGGAPAIDASEDISVFNFAIRVKPVTVEITKWPEGEIVSGRTFTITAVAKNHSSQLQEVIYYLDYSPETPTPLLSGTVAIDYDGKGPRSPEMGYKWGQKVPIEPGTEQILYISLAPAPWFPSSTSAGDLQLKLRVVRWLGPRG